MKLKTVIFLCFAMVAVLITLLLQGCATIIMPQKHLYPVIEKWKGRELIVNKEVIINEHVDGFFGVQVECGRMVGPLLYLWSAPLLGCSNLDCEQAWKAKFTDPNPPPCICTTHVAWSGGMISRHESRHCIGYGDF